MFCWRAEKTVNASDNGKWPYAAGDDGEGPGAVGVPVESHVGVAIEGTTLFELQLKAPDNLWVSLAIHTELDLVSLDFLLDLRLKDSCLFVLLDVEFAVPYALIYNRKAAKMAKN